MKTSSNLAAVILLFSTSAFATTSYSPINPEKTEVNVYGTVKKYGVTDGGKNVSANGLEWMRWDVTRTLSVEEALSIFPDYRLATGNEVADLFEAYNLGGSWVPWAQLHDIAQQERVESGYYETPNHTEINTSSRDGTSWGFMSDFGINYELTTELYFEQSVQAVFKNDGNFTNLGLASALIGDAQGSGSRSWSSSRIDWYDVDSFSARLSGIALVRSSVPEIDLASAPLSLALLMGLFALNRERKNKLNRQR